MNANCIIELENELLSFDAGKRKTALIKLWELSSQGKIELPKSKKEVNLHFHTFFSFNSENWSPSRIAWEAKKYGLLAAGIVDFDVFDSMEEFLSATELLQIRSSTAMETRVYLSEYADQVITSPNEPGITYFMGAGCYKLPDKGIKAHETLQWMRDIAKTRNISVMKRVNEFLDDVKLDYEKDVVPLTPSGNATERHMLSAYDSKSRCIFEGNEDKLIKFWAEKLETSIDETKALLNDIAKFHEKIRSKLMKFGGVGYVAPTTDTFPQIERVIDMIIDMDALPTATWLDGTNPGESDMPALLELFKSKGVIAMNIVPDRNWNIKNPDEKAIKIRNLGLAVKAANDIGFPLCIGTEMNKKGLPFVDNFYALELQPFIEDFMKGAYFFWGHTLLSQVAEAGYMSDWAKSNLPAEIKAKNDFYIKVGEQANPEIAFSKLRNVNISQLTALQVLKALE